MDLAAQTNLLANTFGAAKAAGAPASFEVDLYTDHPNAGGVLLSTGYASPTVTNDGVGIPTVANGEAVGALVTINFTAELDEPAKYWRFRDPATGNNWVAVPLEVEFLGGAGKSETFQPVVTYGDVDVDGV